MRCGRHQSSSRGQSCGEASSAGVGLGRRGPLSGAGGSQAGHAGGGGAAREDSRLAPCLEADCASVIDKPGLLDVPRGCRWPLLRKRPAAVPPRRFRRSSRCSASIRTKEHQWQQKRPRKRFSGLLGGECCVTGGGGLLARAALVFGIYRAGNQRRRRSLLCSVEAPPVAFD